MLKISSGELELIGMILVAKSKIEKIRIPHRDQCPATDDSGHPAKCTCGADEHNTAVREALSALEIKTAS